MKCLVLAIALLLCTATAGQGVDDTVHVKPEISMVVYGQDDQEDQKAEVVIKAPTRVKVGDLIVIDLSESLGAGFDYEVEPMPPGLRTFDNGRIIVCGTGSENVVFNFMVSCALDGDSDIAIHKVTVTVDTSEDKVDIVSKVAEWAALVDSPNTREDALKLSQSFSSVAVVIEQGTFKNTKDLVRATAMSNRDALNGNLEHWVPFLDALMLQLRSMSISDVKSHAVVWRDVAAGLQEYANSLE